MALTRTDEKTFEELYDDLFLSLMSFFRYEDRHPEALKYPDEYYEKVAKAIKSRIDHEIKHLHSPYLE